jgi:hypothetical protein
MDWKVISKKLLGIAPGIAAAVGGPAGPVVGLGIKALTSALGLEHDTPAELIDKAIDDLTGPEAVELKKADNDFIVKMKELDVDVFKLEVKDKGSARDREEKVGSLDNRVIAFTIVGGFVGVIFVCLFSDALGKMNPVQISIASALFGYLSAKADTVIGYYFGTSKSSSDKNDAIAKAIK